MKISPFLRRFLQRLTSRKFLLALVGAIVVFGNGLWDWGLEAEQVWQILVPLLAFIGVEGARDIRKA